MFLIFGIIVLIYSICKAKFNGSQEDSNSVLFGLYSEFQSKSIAFANWGLLLVFWILLGILIIMSPWFESKTIWILLLTMHSFYHTGSFLTIFLTWGLRKSQIFKNFMDRLFGFLINCLGTLACLIIALSDGKTEQWKRNAQKFFMASLLFFSALSFLLSIF